MITANKIGQETHDSNIDNILLTIEEQARLQKLTEKQQEKHFEVAFCGHFSAGKSTILNTLLGAEVLPTSPIPTSANIIGIKNGEFGLSLRTKDGQEKIWNGEIPWNQVRKWGMNGHDISEMTITAPLPFLGDHSCILDTPGVDSTDEAHEAVTVEQLYTTDVIVYVMDYNHVQSETNLYFLKQLSLEKKPIYIVINQVDKHNEKEIPFSIFNQSIQDVFQRWEIQYNEIYFTSMKHPLHPLNQYRLFEKEIKSLLFNSKNLLEGSIQCLEQGVYQSAVYRLQQQKLDEIDQIHNEMKEKGYHLEQLEEQQQLQVNLHSIQTYEQKLQEQFEHELGSLFKTAILFPFTTTDLARSWIESLQPGFKVGVLFSKKKTLEEQDQRLERLVKELQEKIKSQLIFHVITYFQRVDRSILSNERVFEEALNKINFYVTPEWLKSQVKLDHSSRDYVFVFTREITTIIVSDLRKKSREVVELHIEGMKEYIQEEEKILTEKLREFKQIEEYSKKIEDVTLEYTLLMETMNQKLAMYPSANRFNQLLMEASHQSYPEYVENGLLNIVLPEESVIETDWRTEEVKPGLEFSKEEIASWSNKIKEILINHKSTSILAQERNDLLERLKRYEQQTFTVSLFGAFSAGKSSFANALLGDYVLPVSPNPTTATINTIEKSTNEYAHGTARVTLKTRANLSEEIKAVSEQLDLFLDIDQINHWNPNKQEYISSWQKTSIDYLITIKKGLAETSWQLGTAFTVHLSEVQQYIADEQKACLIDKVNIYYDSPITNNGIILVDTPGVNSIHGRHTNVAFQQMRSSDAIFYLTYYNHAFSKADQYFLQQMGKVNESFRQDKLYFIINASDLANNAGELNGVKKHVHDQLVRNGIEHPRLFHLSSKKGLHAKKEGYVQECSFTEFEAIFYEQTILEFKQLSVKLLAQQLQQFEDKINDSISFMNAEQSEQQAQHQKLQQIVKNQTERVNQTTFHYVLRDVLFELDQLILYLRDRMRFVLSDYFPQAINVAVLTGNTKKELHQQLVSAIKEWKGLGEYFLKQELEATVIRMEEKMKARANQWFLDELKKSRNELPYLYLSDEVNVDPIQIGLQNKHLSIDYPKFLPYLKSKKDFFENGMIKQLKEELMKDGLEAANNIISFSEIFLQNKFEQQIDSLEQELKQRLITAFQHEMNRFEALFDHQEKALLINEYKSLYLFLGDYK